MVARESVLELMNQAGAVFLATVDGSSPRIRAMVNLRRRDLYPSAAAFCQRQGFTCYFTTSLSSGKVRELRANPQAAIYFCDPERVHGAMLTGLVEILDDPELKKTLWDDSWRIYWPAGPDDPDLVILRLAPALATGWWGTTPFTFELAAP
jgi:general stress protein 26